jgi:hypothetical protein
MNQLFTDNIFLCSHLSYLKYIMKFSVQVETYNFIIICLLHCSSVTWFIFSGILYNMIHFCDSLDKVLNIQLCYILMGEFILKLKCIIIV